MFLPLRFKDLFEETVCKSLRFALFSTRNSKLCLLTFSFSSSSPGQLKEKFWKISPLEIPEIIRVCAQFLSAEDLQACILVSKVWCDNMVHEMYATIWIQTGLHVLRTEDDPYLLLSWKNLEKYGYRVRDVFIDRNSGVDLPVTSC